MYTILNINTSDMLANISMDIKPELISPKILPDILLYDIAWYPVIWYENPPSNKNPISDI